MVQSPHGINFESNRPVIMGRNGMVSAGHPLAAQAGMAILQKGGNAIDAAIATAAALNVVEPNMSGVGGDGYIMIYNRAQNKVDVCNATGAAPYATDLATYQATGIPQKGDRYPPEGHLIGVGTGPCGRVAGGPREIRHIKIV